MVVITVPFIVCILAVFVGSTLSLYYYQHTNRLSLEEACTKSCRESTLWKIFGRCSVQIIGTRGLAIYRTMAALFAWYLILRATFEDGFYRFRNLTVWNWCLLILYFTCSALLTWHNYCGWFSLLFESTKSFRRHFAMVTWTIYQIECANVLFVDFVAWCILYPFASESETELLLTSSALHMHFTNMLLLYIDVIINQLPINKHFSWFTIELLVIYVVFQWIWVQFGYPYSYPFLDTSKIYNLGIYVGMCVLNLFMFRVAVWITQYRDEIVLLTNYLKHK